MVIDWRPPMVWKPEFVAFAAEHGRTPDEQDAHDRAENPARPRTAFAAWLAKQAAARKLPAAVEDERAQAERWARSRFEGLGGAYPAWDEMAERARAAQIDAMLPLVRECRALLGIK